ncbi:hypothetical protein F5X68DRAFT_197494 [Plectosphaerella plurivora]|uniref:Uncharacterized protein n=1 Tax=Plectosphaerella plurivora TaxID=936078 RepID=A0A9P8VNK5_9PEZI|nr:hypothetical protein F5X68DRAFT_197494 [Plectosphaerella plurivora]
MAVPRARPMSCPSMPCNALLALLACLPCFYTTGHRGMRLLDPPRRCQQPHVDLTRSLGSGPIEFTCSATD